MAFPNEVLAGKYRLVELLGERGSLRTQLDYVFVSEQLLPGITCEVRDDDAGRGLSDHSALVIDLPVPRGT